MKTTKIILLLACITFFVNVKAQVFQVTTGTFNYGSTVNTMDGIGIGAWPAATATDARLDVNNFYTLFPAGTLNGQLIRTDGDNSVPNMWRMYTGTTAGTTTEIFSLSATPTPTSNFVLHAVVGDMMFNTTATEHLHITAGTIPTLALPSLGARIYTDNLDNFTISNLASSTGFGAFNPLTVFRVVGAGTMGGPLNILEVAEFRSIATDMQETAIKIRGERNTLTSMTNPPANSASIELSN